MIILQPHEKRSIKCAIFDFDGTLSTLRCGWEEVMRPLMYECITGDKQLSESERERIKADIYAYVDESTGIQTIGQMKWLTNAVKEYGFNPGASDDPWFYKAEYNHRLMEHVAVERDKLINGEIKPETYLIRGSEAFLKTLKSHGIKLFAASGTDEEDVIKEATALGLAKYFDEIAGSKPHSEQCSKDEVIKKLLKENSEMIVIGDGKVEIRLGRENGALTLGVASDEQARQGINPVKGKRLTVSGAHAIVGDFGDLDEIMEWML
ncbi:MAG TPA: HAD hydrolase-like protein [Oscillospiraceae bacterium]|nr:HAD hydrolase-like protein [Oscillospiraceae bacterium]HPF57007.1 HAD hydrolase-like protein [Clostridiales bacterium]HPK34240.1 HAD hydrolase-like protein [Oscillospiraceae bacterium]HPR74857.1 HAD hydrolase-like protein [Oscillospiraceae bacterium]